MGMLRPKSIRWFDRLYFAHLACNLISRVFHLLLPLQQSVTHHVTLAIRIGAFVVVYGISLLIWFFISRRGSSFAKWSWMCMMLLGLVLLPRSVARIEHEMLSSLRLTIVAVGWLLSSSATVMLFRPDARAWFAAKGKPIDPAIFD